MIQLACLSALQLVACELETGQRDLFFLRFEAGFWVPAVQFEIWLSGRVGWTCWALSFIKGLFSLLEKVLSCTTTV